MTDAAATGETRLLTRGSSLGDETDSEIFSKTIYFEADGINPVLINMEAGGNNGINGFTLALTTPETLKVDFGGASQVIESGFRASMPSTKRRAASSVYSTSSRRSAWGMWSSWKSSPPSEPSNEAWYRTRWRTWPGTGLPARTAVKPTRGPTTTPSSRCAGCGGEQQPLPHTTMSRRPFGHVQHSGQRRDQGNGCQPQHRTERPHDVRHVHVRDGWDE